MLAVAIKMTQDENDNQENRDEMVNVCELNNKLRCFSLQKKELESWQQKHEKNFSQQKQGESEVLHKSKEKHELESPKVESIEMTDIVERKCWCL